MAEPHLNEQVRAYWEAEPCGTETAIVGALPPHSREWFEQVEAYRYTAEPFIHAVAQFTRYHGKKLLEVGVGAGTDHLQWARAGVQCYGIDLTDAAIATTTAHLALYGFQSSLQRIDAEELPFDDAFFDVVYSWGVMHHTAHPEHMIAEIHRVLKPGGPFIGMLYGRHSLAVFKYWLRYALGRGKPWRTFSDVVWHHVESVGTKAYTIAELRQLFARFAHFTAQPLLTQSDTGKLPAWLCDIIPNRLGWFIAIRAVK
jgi:ubiquinone/menaquinone biosynthesis C-methylase UbiE